MNEKDNDSTRVEIPDWKCERFLLNELDETEMEEIRRALESDERLRERLEAIERSNDEILREYPPGWMASQIREKLGRDKTVTSGARREYRFWHTRRVLVPAAVLAVVALAVVVPRLIPPGDQTSPDIVRIKGPSSQLSLYRKTASGSERLRDGDSAAEHDLVLLQYQVDARCYGAILSVDARGTITRHVPEHDSLAVEMQFPKPHPLEYAYELDDAPGWEVFFLVTASNPFPVDGVVGALEESLRRSGRDGASQAYIEPPQSLMLPEDFRISTFTLIKDSGHEN